MVKSINTPKSKKPFSSPAKFSKQSLELRRYPHGDDVSKAEAAHDWEKAAFLYTQLLESLQKGQEPGRPDEFWLLERRAACYRRLGNIQAEAPDLERMTEIAEHLEDPALQVRALNLLEFARVQQGRLEDAHKIARQAFTLAHQTRDPQLEADSLASLTNALGRLNQFSEAIEVADQSLQLYRLLNDLAGEARVLREQSYFMYRQGNAVEAQILGKQAVELSRRAGDLEGEANALVILGIIVPDQAQKRNCYEQALTAFGKAGNRERQVVVGNNLGLLYLSLGLYNHAREMLDPVVAYARQSHNQLSLAYFLGSLGNAYLGLGEAEQAIILLKEGIDLTRQIGDKVVESFYEFELGRAFFVSDRLDDALDHLKKAEERLGNMQSPDQATVLAWLGAVYLSRHEITEAQKMTTPAVIIQEKFSDYLGEYPLQDIWWWHYRALKEIDLSPSIEQSEIIWKTLDRARVMMLKGIDSLSDDGLRRNYFNKNKINRQIIRAWLEEAKQRKLSLEILTDALFAEGNIQEPFKRLSAIGVRLNALHEIDKLPTFIMNEVLELTGAESAVLFLLADDQALRPHSPTALRITPGIDRELFLKRISRTIKEVADYGQAILRYTPTRATALKQTSILCVPLTALGKQIGCIYTELNGIYGRFTPQDLDLLTVLANQSAVAVENAAWARTLEEKVAQRTAELQTAQQASEQRAVELAIINSVQAGLASRLDMHAIYELVGEKLREIFKAQVVTICTFDLEKRIRYTHYGVEKGELIHVAPESISKGSLSDQIIRSGQPILINHAHQWKKYGASTSPGTKNTKSGVFVPLLVEKQVTGYLSVQSISENVFSGSEVRLLQTLANSISVSLENARLFDETQRLFKAEQQRVADLVIINEVSQVLTQQIELQSLIDLVGEKLRQTFHADIAYVAMLDRQKNIINFPYSYGESEIAAMPYGEGLTSMILKSGQPLLINQDMVERIDKLRVKMVGEQAKSYLGVPIMDGQQAVGVISVQSTRDEGLFDKNDLRLLNTIAASVSKAIQNARLFSEVQYQKKFSEALIQVSPVAIVILDKDNNVSSWNPSAEKLFGYSQAEALGQNLVSLVANHPDYHAEAAGITQQLGQGISVHCFTRRNRKDGDLVDVELLSVPVILDENQVGTFVIYHDITEIKKAQDALQTSEERLRLVIEGAELVTWDWDIKADELTTNNRWLELFGYTSDEPNAPTPRSLISTRQHPDDLSQAQKCMEDHLAGKIPLYKAEYRVKTRSGDWRWTSAIGKVIERDKDGKPVRMTGINLDINEAKRMEAAIRESEHRLADIINFLPDATLVINSESKVIAWNRAIEEMTGIKAKDMLGKGDYEYALPFYGERRPILIDLVLMPREEFVSKYAQIKRTGEILFGETYTPALKGGARYLYAVASPLHDSKGNIVGVIETIRDITERKQAEVELHKAKEAADAANEAKSAFLAMMSHEIRTPMNAIIGMSGLLLDTELNADQHDFAETIRNSGDALLNIINDILDFSKIEAGRMDLEEQPFDLRECIEASLDLLKLRASKKDLELAYQMEDDVPPTIRGDVTRLRQVLVNLLSNAVKFTEQGEIELSVTLASPGKPIDGKYNIQFIVRDTGIGIPSKQLSRLFQPFSQADVSTARKYGGTGLGLAISNRLAELMGGKLWAESQVGRGSRFHFTIQAPSAPEIKIRPHIKGEQPQLRGKRLLVVDDNATNRRILSLQAKTWGILVKDTASPGEALDWVRRGEPFDIAILDMHMPEMEGTRLASEIRKLRDAKVLPLVLFSSLGGREAGVIPDLFTAALVKPLRPSLLLDTLMNVFNISQPQVDDRAAQTISKPGPEMAGRYPLRILLAEDNAVNQKLALRLLSQMGYRADLAANGLEAIQAVERQPYDVILMDVQMPEMDGLEATQKICARWPGDQRPQIIAMTANALQGDREMCLEAGMDDYISKPIRVADLVAALMAASNKKVISSG